MKRIIIGITLILVSASVLAGVKIIGKIGRTEPVSFYLGDILHAKKAQAVLSENQRIKLNFQVKTALLSPGVVKFRNIHAPALVHPIFIIGNDELSKKWLKKYSGRLNQIHALGLIVNTSGIKETKEIENKFHVTLIPVNGSELSKRFNLRHYPVLISKHRIEQ